MGGDEELVHAVLKRREKQYMKQLMKKNGSDSL